MHCRGLSTGTCSRPLLPCAQRRIISESACTLIHPPCVLIRPTRQRSCNRRNILRNFGSSISSITSVRFPELEQTKALAMKGLRLSCALAEHLRLA